MKNSLMWIIGAIWSVVLIVGAYMLTPAQQRATNTYTFEANQVERNARGALRDYLVDPDTARFSDLSTSFGGAFICGRVNARNMLGGYTGYQRFVIGTETIQFEPDDRDGPRRREIFDGYWAQICRGENVDALAPTDDRTRNVVELLGG